MPRGGIATYIGRRADLYRSTRRAILVDEATYIGSPSDQYSFARPSSMDKANTFRRNKEASPQKKRREAIMRSPVLRSRGLRRAGDTTPI